jgi:hypothetical protein
MLHQIIPQSTANLLLPTDNFEYNGYSFVYEETVPISVQGVSQLLYYTSGGDSGSNITQKMLILYNTGPISNH